VGREHRACRTAAALFDQTSFAKAMLVGRDAESALSWIAANNVAKPPGSVIYTQMLNRKGGIECDLTVTRIDRDRYYIVTGTGFATHDFDWIGRSIPDKMAATLVDVTSANCVLALMGPRARDILQSCCDDDLANAAFPFMTAREIRLAGAPVLAIRVTYVGELGWELHIPVEFALAVYDRLTEAGTPFGLANAGYRAIESLRLEKGYRAWGADIGPDHTPPMAGLGWAVKLKSGLPFQGREALEKAAATPLPRLLVGFAVEDPAITLLGRETIYRDGERVGWLTSGGFGYSVGKPIGYGYVRNPAGVDRAFALGGSYELDVAGERVRASASAAPFYDPSSARIRA
jgi:4-methylaminobutanoate oxidase (formaldehyde-forming)